VRALGSWSLVAVLAASAATFSCLTTRNFTQPEGPRYEGGYGLASSEAEATASSDPLRVVTFNIAQARQIELALTLLRSDSQLRKPDLLLLQEMDADGVERIARELRLNYVYFPSAVHPETGRQFGTSILSPWPLGEPRKIVLPHASFGTRIRRAATSAVVHRGDLRIRAYAVHLSAPGAIDDDERREQVQTLVDDAVRESGPVVIAGDFNSRQVGTWFREAGFLWLTDRLPGTAHGLGFWWSFDHVFVRGLRPAGQTPAAGVVDADGISDHRAVWVHLIPLSR
jgi:endonuclease/exonuclease/phosphatase (EEP) superfamily protein YafD